MDAIFNFNLVDVAQIIFADIILSGDNALVIGMAAASLSPELRKKAIFMGMALAAGLRIFFAAIATYLLAIPGIIFFGGILLSLRLNKLPATSSRLRLVLMISSLVDSVTFVVRMSAGRSAVLGASIRSAFGLSSFVRLIGLSNSSPSIWQVLLTRLGLRLLRGVAGGLLRAR